MTTKYRIPTVRGNLDIHTADSGDLCTAARCFGVVKCVDCMFLKEERLAKWRRDNPQPHKRQQLMEDMADV